METRAADLRGLPQADIAKGRGTWTLHLQGDPGPCGTASLGRVSSVSRYEPRLANQVEPTIAISQFCPERGVGRAVMFTPRDYGFDALGLEEIVASIDADTQRPQRLGHGLTTLDLTRDGY